MKLTLCSVGNPDFGQYAPPSPRIIAEVASFEEASHQVRAYIAAHDLGGGNWSRQSGILRDRGKVVGCVSYNGRVWPPGAMDAPTLPDPLYDPRKALP